MDNQTINRSNAVVGFISAIGLAGGAYLLGSAIKRIYDGIPMQELKSFAGLAKHKAVVIKGLCGTLLVVGAPTAAALKIRGGSKPPSDKIEDKPQPPQVEKNVEDKPSSKPQTTSNKPKEWNFDPAEIDFTKVKDDYLTDYSKIKD